MGLEIRQETDLFQRFYRERLGLVNNQDGSLSLSINRKEVLVYKSDQRWEIKAAGIWFQVRSEFSQEIQNKSFGSLLGIQNERDLNIGGRLFKEAANQSRFPGSDLPGELDKPPFLRQTVEKMGKSLLVLSAQKKKARVRCHPEGLFAQAKVRNVRCVHPTLQTGGQGKIVDRSFILVLRSAAFCVARPFQGDTPISGKLLQCRPMSFGNRRKNFTGVESGPRCG